MKLELTNFRSFSKAEFNFGSDYTLISGPSGAGKTSIFMAIQFAISGEGKKIVKNGKTKCCVVFETPQIKITRTKGPCRLCVVCDNTSYEDACAQAIIDKTLPNWELGYVSQRLYKSFILMTPADKLELIEKMSFSGTDVGAIQNRCKSLITERKNTLEDAKKERITIERVLTDIGCAEKSNVFHDNDLKEELVRFRAEKASVLKRLADAKRNWDQKKFLLSQLEELKQEIHRTVVDLPYTLQELIKQKENFNRYVAVKRQLDETTPHSGMSEQEIDSCIQDMNSLKTMQSKLINLPKLRNELKQREDYKKTHAVCIGTCPECSTLLSSWNGKLMLTTDNIKNITPLESEACEQSLNRLLAEISVLEELEKENEKIKSLYEGEIDAVEQLRYLAHVKKNDKLWENWTTIKCENPPDDIIKLAQEAELSKFNQKTNQEKFAKINNSLSQLEPRLENVELLEKRVDELSQTIQDIETEIKCVETRKQWDTVRKLREVEREMETKLPSAVRLSTLVKTAERLSLEEILGNINLRAGIYLQRILPSVNANLVFEAKNTTEKIDLKLSIDNLPTDVNSLSGGEFARLVLAFAIAMTEMNNVDILILDESFASLDSETTEIVLCAIKENYFGKVIVIAHQTTKGVFDEVIEL